MELGHQRKAKGLRIKDKKMAPDIEKRTFNFSVLLLSSLRGVPQNPATNVILNQLMRSGTSIGANVTEGRASASKKDFINFHSHALKSARETIYWLRLLQTVPVSEQNLQTYAPLIQEVTEISKVIGKIIISCRKNMSV